MRKKAIEKIVNWLFRADEVISSFLYRNSYTFGIIAVILVVTLTVTNVFAYQTNQIKELKNAPPLVLERVEYVEVTVEPDYFPDYDFSKMTKSQIKTLIENYSTFLATQNITPMLFNTPYEEANEIINLAYEAMENNMYLYPYSDDDLNLLAYMINVEAGSSYCSDEEQQLVGCVLMNRVAHGGINGNISNPTLTKIINERGQYAIAIKRGYNININTISIKNVPSRCIRNAAVVLEHGIDCPSNVMFQAMFKQGSGVYKSFKHGKSYEYFCYL